MCSDTVLAGYDPKCFTRIYADHGPQGVASTVAQQYDTPGKHDPEYRPVAYTSRSLKQQRRTIARWKVKA